MRSLIFALLTFGLCGAAFAEDTAAIAPLNANASLTPDEQQELAAALRKAIEKRMPTQSVSETQVHIDAAKSLGMTCSENDRDCWRQVRNLSTAENLILCQAARAEGNVQIDVRLDLIRDAANNDKEATVSIKFPLSEQAMDELVGRLFFLPARVVFAVAPSDAIIYLNDAVVGKKTMDLSAGEYVIRAEAPGYESVTKTVTVKAGALETIEIALPLQTDKTLAYVGLGVGGAMAVVGGALTLFGMTAVNGDDFQSDGQGGAKRLLDDGTLGEETLDQAVASSNVIQGVGIAIGVVGVALAGTGLFFALGE